MQILERGLEASNLRHTVMAQNLANVNTPNYKAARVLFEEYLQRALTGGADQGPTLALVTTHQRHLGAAPVAPAQVRPVVTRDTAHAGRPDGNNVDLEAEMARVAANQVWYQALARQVNDEFARLRMAASEGRR